MSLHDHDPVIARIDADLAEPALPAMPATPNSITCPHCHRTSYNPNDMRERYCGACHRYHDDGFALGTEADEPQLLVLTPDQVAEIERQLRRKFTKQIRKPNRLAVLDESTNKWVPVRRPWFRRRWNSFLCWCLWTQGRLSRWWRWLS